MMLRGIKGRFREKIGEEHGYGHVLAVGIPLSIIAILLLFTSRIEPELLMLLLVFAPLAASKYGIVPGVVATLFCVAIGAFFFLVPATTAGTGANIWANLLAFAVVGIAVAATSWKAAQQAKTLRQLRESEARKSAMINTSLDAIVMMNDEGKVVEFNPAAEEIFGYRREDAIGQEMAELIIPSVYRASHRAGLARYLQSHESRILSRRLELTAIRSSGAEFPVELVIARVADVDPPLFTGYIRDVTKRKEAEDALRVSEEKFRDLADNISQLAWMADDKGNRFWYNQRWIEYTGGAREEMQGEGWKQYHHPEHRDAAVKRFQHSIETGEPWEDTVCLRGKDGRYRWFLSHALPIRNADGEVIRWFGTNTDVTEQRKLQEELRQLAARLSMADRRKDEFLATLAHELRNPLAAIRTGLEIVTQEKDVTPAVAEVHAVFDRQTRQLVCLVDDLLDISRITQGKLKLAKHPVKLQEVIQTALETAQPLLNTAGHRLTIDLPDQQVYLNADPQRLAQVVVNLLSNAIKYTPGNGEIWLSATQQEGSVNISVKDSGVGIPSEQQEHVFEMFSQIDRPLEKGYTGLGIGLTLAKSIVEMHGGSIGVESQGLGHGSEFTMSLPTLAEQRVEPSPAKAVHNAKTDERHRILVVDDNKDVAETLSKLLRLNSYQVRTAGDGKEAIKVAKEYRPDVILMDLGMPKMNGYEACRHIRTQPWGKNVVLVALSGWGQQRDKDRTKDAGFDHHIVKPVASADLLNLLSEASF